MFHMNSRIWRFKVNLKCVVKYCSSNAPTNFPELIFQPKFSSAEQEKILNILNGSNKDQLSCLNVAQSKIKNLESYKKRKGPFKSLDELLEVDGLNLKILEKLCKQILTEPPIQNQKPVNDENKRIKQLLVPQFPANMTNTLSSAVGIHLAPMGVSWAKLIKTNSELECWGYEDFVNLPKKLCPTDTFKLAMKILNQLPPGDVYVFEGTNGMGLQGQKQPSTVTSYTLQLELSSMLLALINTKCNNKDYEKDDDLTNYVYFLRSKLPARLFKTLVGNECVSNTATILHLLGEPTPHHFTLPCSPIVVASKLKNDYLIQSSAHKELLGQALMLTIAFTDLCVRKNPDSIKALMPNRR